MSWDPFQREVLAELGLVLYRSAADTGVLTDEVPASLPPPAAVASQDAVLLAKLARAAGVPVEALPAALQAPAALARLRGDGNAKRALWPQLRALRAQTP